MSTIRNSVMLVGHPTQPRMYSDQNLARFNIAVQNVDRNKCHKADVFSCVGFDDTAKRIVSTVKEGRMVAIDGSLHTYEYRLPNGEIMSGVEITVHDIFLIDPKKGES